MEEHPDIHPDLRYFAITQTIADVCANDDTAIKFLEEVGLIPSRCSVPPNCCDSPMRVERIKNARFGWRWRCRHKTSRRCRKSISPSEGTFFDGSQSKAPVCDVLRAVFAFVAKMRVTEFHKDMTNVRRREKRGKMMSATTAVDYYSYCREVAMVISSHDETIMGGMNRTVQVDETFLTRRKNDLGRITSPMTMVILGIMCRETRTCRFFHVQSKSKAELWPYLKKYIAHDTSRVATDAAKQYCGVERLFSPATKHLVTNHSIGQYVDANDPHNTINPLENQNKLLKRAILCRRSVQLVEEYMALRYYRMEHLEKQYKNDIGSQDGLQLRCIDKPTLSSEGIRIEDVYTNPRMRTIEMSIEEEISEADEIESDEDDDDDDSDLFI